MWHLGITQKGGFKIESPGGVRGLGGGYLLSHIRSTIGVVRLNFSVRNGKRWIPHAITTLFFFLRHLSVRIRLRILTETLVTLVLAFVTLRLACLPDSSSLLLMRRDHALFLSRKTFGRLVLLGFDVAVFTPAAYLRHRL